MNTVNPNKKDEEDEHSNIQTVIQTIITKTNRIYTSPEQKIQEQKLKPTDQEEEERRMTNPNRSNKIETRSIQSEPDPERSSRIQRDRAKIHQDPVERLRLLRRLRHLQIGRAHV